MVTCLESGDMMGIISGSEVQSDNAEMSLRIYTVHGEESQAAGRQTEGRVLTCVWKSILQCLCPHHKHLLSLLPFVGQAFSPLHRDFSVCKRNGWKRVKCTAHLLLVGQENPSAFRIVGFFLLRTLSKVSGVTRQVRANGRISERHGKGGRQGERKQRARERERDTERDAERGGRKGRTERHREMESCYLLLLFHIMLCSSLRTLRTKLLFKAFNLCSASARSLCVRARAHTHKDGHAGTQARRHAGKIF